MLDKLLKVTNLELKRLAGVCLLITLSGFLDILGIGLVAPFSAVVFSPDLSLNLPIVGDLNQYQLLKTEKPGSQSLVGDSSAYS